MSTSSEKNLSERTALLRTLKQRFASTGSYSPVTKSEIRKKLKFIGNQEQLDATELIVRETTNLTPLERQQVLEMLVALHASGAGEDKYQTDFIIDSMAKHAKQMLLLQEDDV